MIGKYPISVLDLHAKLLAIFPIIILSDGQTLRPGTSTSFHGLTIEYLPTHQGIKVNGALLTEIYAIKVAEEFVGGILKLGDQVIGYITSSNPPHTINVPAVASFAVTALKNIETSTIIPKTAQKPIKDVFTSDPTYTGENTAQGRQTSATGAPRTTGGDSSKTTGGGKVKNAGQSFLVVGGATSVGQLGQSPSHAGGDSSVRNADNRHFFCAAIQFARLSGFSPILTTASLHNTAFLKSLGATHVLDRKLPVEELKAAVTKAAGGFVHVVYDAVSLPDTLPLAVSATAQGGALIVVLDPELIAQEAEKTGRTIHRAIGILSYPLNRDLAKSLVANIPALLVSGDIKVWIPDWYTSYARLKITFVLLCSPTGSRSFRAG